MTAFDYTTQQWISGPEALVLRREQDRAELALLEGKGGDAYVALVGGSKARRIAELRVMVAV